MPDLRRSQRVAALQEAADNKNDTTLDKSPNTSNRAPPRSTVKSGVNSKGAVSKIPICDLGAQNMSTTKLVAVKKAGSGKKASPVKKSSPFKKASSGKKDSNVTTATMETTEAALDKIRNLNSKKPLMRIPGELRNKIYLLAIEDDLVEAKLRVNDSRISGDVNVTTLFKQLLNTPRFINTCHQMRTECSGLFNPKTVELYHRLSKQYAGARMSALGLRHQLKGCWHTTAYQHETALEAKKKWQRLVQRARHYTMVGVVTWDSSLDVKPMWFAGESGESCMSFWDPRFEGRPLAGSVGI